MFVQPVVSVRFRCEEPLDAYLYCTTLIVDHGFNRQHVKTKKIHSL